MTRLGAIGFINTLPVYLDLPGAEGLRYDAPARLNAAIRQGELDVSPVSSACYLRERDDLVLLSDLSVSSPGSVDSVLFLSRVPLDESLLDQPKVAVPDDSETSIALLRYLIRKGSGSDLAGRFVTYPAGEYRRVLEETGSALIIGDNALLIHDQGIPEGFYCYDLASLWAEATGLPFVFAVWVARRQWAEAHPEELAALNAALRASRDRFFADPELQARGVSLAQKRCTISPERIRQYFTRSLTYGLQQPHHEALERFSGLLKEMDTPVDPDRTRSEVPL